jgi:hypothetical protein
MKVKKKQSGDVTQVEECLPSSASSQVLTPVLPQQNKTTAKTLNRTFANKLKTLSSTLSTNKKKNKVLPECPSPDLSANSQITRARFLRKRK